MLLKTIILSDYIYETVEPQSWTQTAKLPVFIQKKIFGVILTVMEQLFSITTWDTDCKDINLLICSGFAMMLNCNHTGLYNIWFVDWKQIDIFIIIIIINCSNLMKL